MQPFNEVGHVTALQVPLPSSMHFFIASSGVPNWVEIPPALPPEYLPTCLTHLQVPVFDPGGGGLGGGGGGASVGAGAAFISQL